MILSWAPTPIPRSRSRGSSDTRARARSRAHTQTHTGTHARGPARARTRRCVHTGVLRLASTLQGKALLHPDVQAAGGPANRPRDVTMPWRRCRLLCLLDARAVCSSTSFSLHRPAYRNPDLGKAPPAWTGRAQGHTVSHFCYPGGRRIARLPPSGCLVYLLKRLVKHDVCRDKEIQQPTNQVAFVITKPKFRAITSVAQPTKLKLPRTYSEFYVAWCIFLH